MPFIESAGKRILFVHIPRTAGTSIEQSMRSLAPLRFFSSEKMPFLSTTPQHFRLHELKALFGDEFFDYCFTVVRNPYRRIESIYRMRAMLAQERFIKTIPPFAVWLQVHLPRAITDPFYLDGHLRPQTDYIGSGMKVFRYEAGLQAIVNSVSEQTGLSLELPEQRYLSSNSENGIEWNYESLSLVNKFYAHDFKAFRYSVQIPEFEETSSIEIEL